MKHSYRITAILLLNLFCGALRAEQNDSIFIRQLFSEILNNGKCYSTLDHLTNQIGGRLSGSPQAEQAVQYMYGVMKGYGFDSVWLQPVMVPHWVRGEKEQAYMVVNGKKEMLSICALGNSIGTGSKGISAQVIEVKTFEELAQLGKEKIKGKIIFFNRPFPNDLIIASRAYGMCVNQRSQGAMQAARYGAVGVVVRSMTHALDDYPHTGAMRYNDTITKIPACAVSTIAANKLSEQLKRDPNTVFYFKQTCEMLPDVQSYNVIAELKGGEKPNEFIIVGGHLDAWDITKGAHDDGTGVVQSVEVLRTLRALNIRPKRTIRVVLFMNEENGLRGGKEYAEQAFQKNEKHLAALESDGGGFTPRNFQCTAMGDTMQHIRQWEKYLRPYGIEEIKEGDGGADIDPLKNYGTVCMEFAPDPQRYFDYHHTANDTFDKVNKRELELGAGCMAAMVWLLSEYGVR